MKDVKVTEILIGTERVTNIEGRDSNVSSIEIDLTNNKKKR